MRHLFIISLQNQFIISSFIHKPNKQILIYNYNTHTYIKLITIYCNTGILLADIPVLGLSFLRELLSILDVSITPEAEFQWKCHLTKWINPVRGFCLCHVHFAWLTKTIVVLSVVICVKIAAESDLTLPHPEPFFLWL